MSVWAILATGPSMSQEVADSVRGRCGVIAVSNAYRLAPWADALVSNDIKWWDAFPDAKNFSGRKFCGAYYEGTEHLRVSPKHGAGTNSGLQGMRVARDHYGATKILLLGFDMHGTHFFGKHQPPLNDASVPRRDAHIRQFKRFDTKNCVVINCTEGSRIPYFQFGKLEEHLQ